MTLNGKNKNMISKTVLKNCLFLDVETATSHKDYDTLAESNPRLAKLWERRAKYYRTAYEEMNGLDDKEIYLSKASLEPEFSRVVCVSFGVIQENDSIRMTSFFGEDELDILQKSAKVLANAVAKGMKLSGHNIKGFDIPCLGKRMIYTDPSSNLPSNLIVWDKKPWEIPYLDTSEVFAFGSWSQQKYLSLDLLACSLGIESPKEGIDGSLVSNFYWELKQYDMIKDYCERDVKTVIDLLLKVAK
jgi:hypothetical protein